MVAQFLGLGSRQQLANIKMKTMTIGEHWIESPTSAKILGVTFDTELDLHVNCQQYYSKLLLSIETAEIHKTIIHHGFRENIDPLPHIEPCWLLQLYFYCATNSFMRRLQSVLSAAVRLISHKRCLTHHSCAEWSTTLASHLPAYWFQDHSLRPQHPPWTRSTYYLSCTCIPVSEVSARAHLRSVVWGDIIATPLNMHLIESKALVVRRC